MKNNFSKIYTLLTDDDEARACKAIPERACRAQPRNYVWVLLASVLTSVSDTLSSTKLVMPWLLSTAGIPSFFSGLLVPIRESGSMLPQLLIGAWVRRFPRRKYFYTASSVAQALALLGIMLVALTLEGATAGWMVLLCVTIYSLSRSFTSVSSKDVLGKTVDKQKRGQVSGSAASFAGGFAILVGLAVAWGRPINTLSITLLLAASALAMLLSGVLFALIDEYEGATDGGKNGLREVWRSLGLIKTDRDFRRFVITRALMMSSGLATPYIVMMAQRSGSDWFGLGIFIAISGLASFVSSVFWGNQADKDSRAVMMWTALATAIICALSAGFAGFPDSWHALLYGLSFFLISVTHQGVRLGRKVYVVDLAEGNQRTTYVTVSNTLIGVLLLFVGLISALLSQLAIPVALGFFATISLIAVWSARQMKRV